MLGLKRRSRKRNKKKEDEIDTMFEDLEIDLDFGNC